MTTLVQAYVRLLRFGFYLLYNPFAFTYDLVANVVSLGRWWAWQRAALDFLPATGDILEVGHGTGHLLETLHQRGCQPLALDLSPNMGRIARRRLRQRGLAPRIMRGSVLHLPLPARSLDAIVATFPTEYIVQTPAMAEFRRVLRPGGRLVFVPAAMLLGGGPLRGLIRLAFWLTGQSASLAPTLEQLPGWAKYAQAHYHQAGFTVQVETVALADSRVWVVVAELASAA